MIRVTGLDNGHRHCDGITRRSFLQAGALGVGGFALGDLLRARASQPAAARDAGTSVILFWMSGGPGHMETWDPKPEAPSEWRGPFGAIKTNVDGIQFGELLPESATWRFSGRSTLHIWNQHRQYIRQVPRDSLA